ncbi:MAG: ATPase, partial [Gemmatimonadetes bacterium]|nr:ATPase [Gemmatimonadota bacterium]
HRYVAVRVTDTGPGIAREHLPRLTERFYRVEGQKSGDRPGTGLGLSIVKHVANRHRGGFAVESTLGAGSTFIVYFPMLEAKLGVLASGALEAQPRGREDAEPAAATKLS